MMRRMGNRAALLTLIVVAALVALMQFDFVPVRSQKTVVEQPARHASVEISEATKQQVVVAYGKLPLSFETNQGQTDSRVKFLSRGSGYTLFLTSTEAVLALRSPRAKPSAADHGAATRPEPPAKRDVLRIRLVGANPAPQMTGLDALPGKSNYFIGKDAQKWRKNIPHYAKVDYEEVYPGIDLVFYGNQRRLEYDFVVAPGADPGAIALDFEGNDRLEIDPQGDLVVRMAGGEVRFQKPFVYQELDGARQIVPSHYALKSDDRIGFQIAAYDASKPLIIDPVLAYSTYLGGSDHDAGRAIAVDADGNAYVTGSTKSTDFPTKDPIQANNAGGYDVFVAKLNADGSALVYSTYLGGTQHAFAIAVDSLGNAYVTGMTGSAGSTDFPTSAGAFQEQDPGGNNSAFVTKLSNTGGLVYSTYLGGSSSDKGSGIAVDADGNAYVTGETNSDDFPTASPLQATIAGSPDAFVAKLDPKGNDLDDLLFSTFLGGSHYDEGSSIVVDGAGNVYVTGITTSDDFPITMGAFDPTCGTDGLCNLELDEDGNVIVPPFEDAFVAKVTIDGPLLVYATYLGGASYEKGRGIAVDADGNAYVTGQTSSVDDPDTPEDEGFPTTLGAVQDAHGGGLFNIFVTKLDPTGSGLVYSTYLSSYSEGWGIALDGLNNVYVTGIAMGSVDAIVAKLDPKGNGLDDLLFFTALGGESTDRGRGIAVDGASNAYVTGITWSSEFPTTEGAFQTKLGGTSPKRGGRKSSSSSNETGDAFIVKIVEAPVGITLTATGYKVKGLQKVDLEWSGLTPRVGIYRDGELKAWTSNPGFYTDNIDQKGGGTYTYQVCEEENPTICSDEAKVTF